jgi:diguanylate cyclase
MDRHDQESSGGVSALSGLDDSHSCGDCALDWRRSKVPGTNVMAAPAKEPERMPRPVPNVAPLLPRQVAESEYALFAAVGERRVVEAGAVIFQRGELGRSMFLIERGLVQLEFGDGMPSKVIGPREFFGELALFIGNHARVASAIAVQPVDLYVIDSSAFEQLLNRDALLMAQFMRRSFSYLVGSEQQLISNLKRRNEDLQVILDSLHQTRTQLDTAERLVQTDELTGLCNRRGLYAYLSRLPKMQQGVERLGLLLIDLDRFKQTNDLRGHLMGDRVLQGVAREIQAAAAPCDLPCRLGGDEFALLALVPDRDALEARARQIADGIGRMRFPPPHDDLRISLSIGGRMCHAGGAWSTWYSEADSVLYQVKGIGGDNVRVVE